MVRGIYAKDRKYPTVKLFPCPMLSVHHGLFLDIVTCMCICMYIYVSMCVYTHKCVYEQIHIHPTESYLVLFLCLYPGLTI